MHIRCVTLPSNHAPLWQNPFLCGKQIESDRQATSILQLLFFWPVTLLPCFVLASVRRTFEWKTSVRNTLQFTRALFNDGDFSSEILLPHTRTSKGGKRIPS